MEFDFFRAGQFGSTLNPSRIPSRNEWASTQPVHLLNRRATCESSTLKTFRLSLLAAAACAAGLSLASSHREAPFITTSPKVDATDFYMFRSYEPGRGDYVTLIANYLPLQDPYGGPNYFTLDPNALYEIHIDNNGDAREDLTFQFRFKNKLQRRRSCPIGDKNVADPADPGRPGRPTSATPTST